MYLITEIRRIAQDAIQYEKSADNQGHPDQLYLLKYSYSPLGITLICLSIWRLHKHEQGYQLPTRTTGYGLNHKCLDISSSPPQNPK